MKKIYYCLILCLILSIGLVTTQNGRAYGPTHSGNRRDQHLRATPASYAPDIVGGDIASTGEFPWQVAIVDASQSNPLNGEFCGGSLIAPSWVLSAGHCVLENGALTQASSINVVLGINKLSDGPTSGSKGQRKAVSNIYPYPNYNESTSDSDFSLLHLASPAVLNSTVATITVAGSSDSALFAAGKNATVTGWGSTTDSDTAPLSNDLRKVVVPIVSNTTCNSSASYGGEVTVNMLCAGFAAGGKDSCYGDSGGPLIVSDGLGGWKEAGVVSWGDGCAQPNKYGVYTRIANFKDWIDFKINGAKYHTYFTTIMQDTSNSGGSCTPGAAGDSDNVADAITICSGQTVSGQVSASDLDDVYQISATAGQQLTISMTGSGGDADLYLFPPGSTDVTSNSYSAYSTTDGSSNESIQVTLLATGTWYIDVYSYSGTTNYSLVATLN